MTLAGVKAGDIALCDRMGRRFYAIGIGRHEREIAGARVFTSDQWGDYLLYRFGPRQAVFIDGRSDFYGRQIGDLYLRTAYGRGDWRAVLARYRIALVLTPKEWPLADVLGSSGGWRLVDQDGQAALFERSGPFEPGPNTVHFEQTRRVANALRVPGRDSSGRPGAGASAGTAR